MRVKPIESGGADQGLDGGGAFAGAFAAGEQPVLFPDRDGPDGVLRRIIIDRQVAGFCITDECWPAFEGVVHGFGRAAAGCGLGAGAGEPRMEFGQSLSCLLPQWLPGFWCGFSGLCFQRIQFGNARKCGLRNRALVGSEEIKELAPGMRPAGEFGDASSAEQVFVAGVIIDHEMPAPVSKEAVGMFACPAGLVVEHHDGRTEDLEMAEIKERLKTRIAQLCRYDLVVIDELGYLPMNRQNNHNLFQLIHALYEYRSVILTTNKDFTRWGDFFVDENVAVPIVDRLIHHAQIFMLGGESYRLRQKMVGGSAAGVGQN